MWVGVHVPAGRLFHDELDALAALADEFGSGEVRCKACVCVCVCRARARVHVRESERVGVSGCE